MRFVMLSQILAPPSPDDERQADALDAATRPYVLDLVRAHARRDSSSPVAGEVGTNGAVSLWAPNSLWLAAAALVVVTFGLAYWYTVTNRSVSSLERGEQAIEALMRDSRPTPYRLSGASYAPYSRVRGARTPKSTAAVSQIEAAVAERESAEALRALGRAYLVETRSEDAVRALERARELAPDDVDVTVDFAVALAERGTLPEALRLFDGVLAREPARQEALFNRALVLERLGRTDEARDAWQRYLDTNPEASWIDEARAHLAATTPGSKSP